MDENEEALKLLDSLSGCPRVLRRGWHLGSRAKAFSSSVRKDYEDFTKSFNN